MKFKLLKPRRRRRPKTKPHTPEAFAALVQSAAVQRRKAARQTSRRETRLRRACASEVTRRRLA